MVFVLAMSLWVGAEVQADIGLKKLSDFQAYHAEFEGVKSVTFKFRHALKTRHACNRFDLQATVNDLPEDYRMGYANVPSRASIVGFQIWSTMIGCQGREETLHLTSEVTVGSEGGRYYRLILVPKNLRLDVIPNR